MFTILEKFEPKMKPIVLELCPPSSGYCFSYYFDISHIHLCRDIVSYQIIG
jgi:hypothetical protein